MAFAQLLNEAMGTLGNAEKRRLYDQIRRQHQGADAADLKKDQTETEESAPTAQAKPPTQSRLSLPLQGRAQCHFCHAYQPGGAPAAHTHYLHSSGDAQSSVCQRCGGPATPVALLLPSEGEELRRMYRRDYIESVHVWKAWPLTSNDTAIITDFSPAGCSLECVEHFKIGQIIWIKTSLFEAIGNVKSNRTAAHELFAAGVEFITINVSAGKGRFVSASA